MKWTQPPVTSCIGGSKTPKIMTWVLHSTTNFSRETSPVQPRGRAWPTTPQMDNEMHTSTRICKVWCTDKAPAHHPWTTPAASTRLSRQQAAFPASILLPQLTMCTDGDTHTHSVQFARILPQLHAMVRPVLTRHRTTLVRHVGAFPAPPIDTQYHWAYRAAPLSRRPPRLKEMWRSSSA